MDRLVDFDSFVRWCPFCYSFLGLYVFHFNLFPAVKYVLKGTSRCVHEVSWSLREHFAPHLVLSEITMMKKKSRGICAFSHVGPCTWKKTSRTLCAILLQSLSLK